MNRPPPLRQIFSVYLRLLLIGAIAFILTVTLALRLGWRLPLAIQELSRDQNPARITPTAPGR